nr:hypothetical protein CFP56_73408 [Quercus suber]
MYCLSQFPLSRSFRLRVDRDGLTIYQAAHTSGTACDLKEALALRSQKSDSACVIITLDRNVREKLVPELARSAGQVVFVLITAAAAGQMIRSGTKQMVDISMLPFISLLPYSLDSPILGLCSCTYTTQFTTAVRMAQNLRPGASKPEHQRTMSHGRGGAGNINSKPTSGANPTDFTTPTIKSQTYTTGRGGQGNMATNDPSNPAIARAAQDVDAPAAHQKEVKGTHHWGRGGEGNMVTVGGSEARTSSREGNGGRRTGSFVGDALEKGKEMLGLGKKPGFPQDTDTMAPKTNCNVLKLAAVVSYLQKSRVAHNIKDLEKHLPSVASINGMQVKGEQVIPARLGSL